MLFGHFRTSVVLSRLLEPLRQEVARLGDDTRSLQQQVQSMSAALDNLKAAVAAQVSVDQSAVTLIQGIAAQLKSVSGDTAVQALADELTAAATPLSTAVSASTSAAPAVSATAAASPAPAAQTTPASASGTTSAAAPTTTSASTASTATTPASS